MIELIEKYRKNELRVEELVELQEKLRLASDEEIGKQLLDAWKSEELDSAPTIDNKSVAQLKRKIDAQRRRSKSVVIRQLVRTAQLAAALLFPIALLTSIYYYRENNLIISDEMTISTGKAERANITLPDGTQVALNAESTLKYHPRNYNKAERKISFAGEGYFNIRSNADIPFVVSANALQVTVLGTVFNLAVRETSPTAQLALEKGKVALLSLRNGQNAMMHKNQKAIINQITGEITLVCDDNILDVSAWKRGDMVFRNTKLAQVIKTIEENYNITIAAECDDCLTDTFTGTLPVNDLNEVLEVLERSYHLKAVLNGKSITLR